MAETLKAYVAGAFEQKNEVRLWMLALLDRGYEISSDWTIHRALAPFVENANEAAQFAVEDIQGVKDCDIFVLNTKDSGSGSQAEFGLALGLDKRVYVVGAECSSKLFYFHPNVTRLESFDQFLDLLDQTEAS